MRRLILLSGLGGDARLFSRLRLPGVETLTPAHEPPEDGEMLDAYAARLAAAHRIGPDDVVGGASFGGMLAAQIAASRPVAGLVMLGSTLSPRLLGPRARLAESVSRVLPDAALMIRVWEPFMRARFAPVTPEASAVLRAMARDFPPLTLRRFGRMVVEWAGVARPACPGLVVHGALDRIIPISCARPDLVLQDAGHCFTLTHAEQTSAAVTEFLAGLPR